MFGRNDSSWKFRKNQYKTFFESFEWSQTFRKKEYKTCDESLYIENNRMTHRMFYLLFCETFETTQMIRKMFYIDFCEIFKRNHFDRTMFYTYFFMHIKISPTGKSVLSFIPSGIYVESEKFCSLSSTTRKNVALI